MRIPAIRPSVMLEVMPALPTATSQRRSYSTVSGSVRSASASPSSISSSPMRSNVEMCRSRIRSRASSRGSVARWSSRRVSTSAKPAARSSATSTSRAGKRERSTSSSDGRYRFSQYESKCDSWKVTTATTTTRPEHAPRLSERCATIEEMEHEPEHRALEPAVLERQRLRVRLLERDARHLLLRDREHLRGRVDAPHLRAGVLDERDAEPARAAADVEHATAAEVGRAFDELVDGPPVLVDGPNGVVALGEPPEVRR